MIIYMIVGCFNLSVKGHADCVAFMKSFNKPLLVLGGGGYTLRNVARCWAYETSVLLDTEISDTMPYNDYFEYYGPEYRIHLPVSNMENLNTTQYLHDTKIKIYQQLKEIDFAPSVPFQQTPSSMPIDEEKEENLNPDVRPSGLQQPEHEAEFY